jgi:arylsulfatase A-like enzyme
MIEKSSITLGLALVILGGCSSQKDNSNINQPNIIFIMSDDHAYQAISAYGHPLGKVAPTPQIDRIANEGMRFDRCLVTNSICGPSRATLLTGKYNHKNGMYGNVNYLNLYKKGQQAFPELMRKAGYQTAMIGKWHLPVLPEGFDYWDILPGQGQYYNPDFIDTSGTYSIDGYVTDIITEKGLDWIKNASQKDKPFILLLHQKAPHRPWYPGPKYLDAFQNVSFPEPESLFDDYANRGTAEKDQDMSIRKTMTVDSDLKMWGDTTTRGYKNAMGRMNKEQKEAWDRVYNPVYEQFFSSKLKGEQLLKWKYQRYMNDYLSCIKSVDESVGKVLDYLKSSGLDENTLVVYTSDQGFYLGEHGWFDKRFIFEESLRTPLLIKWKGKIKPGSINTDIVSNLDFAETFLALAGVSIPEDMQGESLIPLLQGNTPSDWRKEHYYHYYEFPAVHQVKRHYGIITERYKLVHFYYDIDEWELFDLQKDPQEMKNVYNDPEYSDIKIDLHKRLDNLVIKYDDSVELNESLLPAKDKN